MTSGQPLVSVIMPVYNAVSFLMEAINSVLNQTYAHFEFIIVNDGSTDDSEKIILNYTDARIRYEKFPENKGIVAALNQAIWLSNGKYIFRMDADDICFPDRLEKQVHFLESHSDVDLMGSKAIFFTETTLKPINVTSDIQNSHRVIKLMLLLCSPFAHPTIAFKKRLKDGTCLQYAEGFNYGDDYELFTRNAEILTYGYLNEVVLYYRVHDSANRLSGEIYKKRYKESTLLIRKKYFTKNHLHLSNKLLGHYEDLFYGDVAIDRYSCLRTVLFYRKIRDHYLSHQLSIQERILLLEFLRKSFYNSFYQYTRIGFYSFVIYIQHCRKYFKMTHTQEFKFLIKSILKR
jgi:glycosyltransferase involved in cell wall biosynthesis